MTGQLATPASHAVTSPGARGRASVGGSQPPWAPGAGRPRHASIARGALVVLAVAIELLLVLGVLGISLGAGDGAWSGAGPDRPPAPTEGEPRPEPGLP
jgi:hypothetical protein